MPKARDIQKSPSSVAACTQTTRTLLAMGNGLPDFVVVVMIPSTVMDRYIFLHLDFPFGNYGLDI